MVFSKSNQKLFLVLIQYCNSSHWLVISTNSSVNFESGNPTVITPVKAAELKTIYISQIKELYSLLEVGAITDGDFQKVF